METIYSGKSFPVSQASLSYAITNRVLCQARVMLFIWVTVVSRNLASYDYFSVERSHVACAIFWGRYRKSLYTHQMWLVQVWLQAFMFPAQRLPEPSKQQFRTSYLAHGCVWLRPSIPVVWICQALSACATTRYVVLHCLEIFPITQPGSSCFLSLPSSVSCSSSSSSSPPSSSSGLARSLRLSPIAYDISWIVFLGFLVVNLTFSPFLIYSCLCIIGLSVSSTHLVATAVSLSK